MENNQENVSLATLALLFRHKWIILLMMFIAGVSATIYSLYFVEVQFKSTVNLVPPKSQGDAFDNIMTNVGSSLKNLGLGSLGGGSGGEYEYMVILDSRTVKDSLIKKYNLSKVYDIPEAEETKLRKAFDANLALDFLKDGNYLISVWDTDKNRAAEIANDYASIANSKATEIAQSETVYNLHYLENRVTNLDEKLKLISDTLAKFSSKYKIFSIEDQAKGYADLLSELKSSKFMYEIMFDINKNKYGEEDYQTKNISDVITQINKKINQTENVPGVIGNFDMSNATDIGLEYARLYTEFETYSKVKAFLIPTLEKTRLDLNKNSSNLFVVDKAIPADKKDRPKRSLIVIGAIFGAFFLSIFFIIVITRTRNLMRQLKQYQ